LEIPKHGRLKSSTWLENFSVRQRTLLKPS